MATHNQRKGTHTSWPQDIGVRGGLGTTLQHTLMYRAEFIHMVALIRARTGIHKREHTSDEQRRFVVCHGERTCKDGASLAILSLAVTEEQRIRCRVVVTNRARLTYKATREHSTLIYTRAARDDKIVAHHAVTDMHGSLQITVYRTIGKT